jgi:molybdopterin-guanine dinucleotide biosynthesis protein B
MAVMQQKKTGFDVDFLSKEFLRCSDFVLVEGGKSDKKLKKIEVLGKGFSGDRMCSPEELAAVVSENEVEEECPVFHPRDVGKIADLLEKLETNRVSPVHLDIDGVSVPINPFVQKIFGNTLLGLVRSLDGIPEEPGCITLSLISEGKTDEKK